MATEYCEESIRDAFIAGLQSNLVHQRLLENMTLDLKAMFDQARSLESAMKSSESYAVPNTLMNAAVCPEFANLVGKQETNTLSATTEITGPSCYFCGNTKHPHSKCPARDATFAKCQKKGPQILACKPPK